jgi:K+-sensing histidine kinase KdpD
MRAQRGLDRLLAPAVLVPLAALAPLVVCLVIVPFRDSVENTSAALVMVLVIVAAAAAGGRVPGMVAAASAAVWFDFFLTRPFQRLTINDESDIETTVLLLAVGLGVTELAEWGRRSHALAEREAAYLAGIEAAAEAVAAGRSPGELVDEVSRQLVQVLGLRSCRFEYGVAGLGRPPRLRDDGQVEWQRRLVDVERDGLPSDGEIELLVESKGQLQGRFMLDAGSQAHPSRGQRLVAVTLASQVGAALR